jgi:hypothetical protein
MALTSKKTSLLLLGGTAIVCSGLMFRLFNDSEGPNLLIVIVAAAFIYVISLVPYLFGPLGSDLKRVLLAISVQALLVVGLYLLLH